MDTTAEFLKKLGETVANQFLQNQEGFPMHAGVVKIANQKDLNPDQIARVCEFANLKAYDELVAKNQDKTAEFKTVDPREVLTDIKANVNQEPPLEYGSPPSKLASFRKSPPKVEKKASVPVEHATSIPNLDKARLKEIYKDLIKLGERSWISKTNTYKRARTIVGDLLKKREWPMIKHALKKMCHNGPILDEFLKKIALDLSIEKGEGVKEFPQNFNMVVRKGHPLVSAVNDHVEAVKKDELIDKGKKVITNKLNLDTPNPSSSSAA